MQFKEISGVIVGSETWSQTHVNGKSQGFSYKGVGGSSGRTTSTVTNVTQIWLKTNEGLEIAVRTNPDKFATREGHQVSMLTMPKGSGPSWMVAGINHTTGTKRRESGFPLIFLAIMSIIFLSWIPVLFVFAFPPLGLLTGALFIWMVAYLFILGGKVSLSGGSYFSRNTGRLAEVTVGSPAAA